MKPWRIANRYLDSLLLLDRDDETSAAHFHGAFIPAVAESLILRLTRPDSWTWDSFAGSGTTGRVAAALDRRVFMTDLNPTGPDILQGDARSVKVEKSTLGNPTTYERGLADKLLYTFPNRFFFDLVILHPPYYNIIKFSDDHADLSNSQTLGGFLLALKTVMVNACRHLKPGGFIGLVIGDIWETGAARWVPLAFLCMEMALENYMPLTLRAIQVKDIKGNRAGDNRRNLRRARCFAAGSVEFTHEYILTFKKVKA